MLWPPHPTCHDTDPAHATASEPSAWLPAGAVAGVPYRTCNRCASPHPEDLIEMASRAMVRLTVFGGPYSSPDRVYVMGVAEFVRFLPVHLLDRGGDDEARDLLTRTLWQHTGLRYTPAADGDRVEAQRLPYGPLGRRP